MYLVDTVEDVVEQLVVRDPDHFVVRDPDYAVGR